MHDIAIYSPFASLYYRRKTGAGAGAELQTTLLGIELAERGVRVAHIVYPVDDPRPLPGSLTLAERPPYRDKHARRNRLMKLFALISEALVIWRSVRAAQARIYVFRGGGAPLVVGALYRILTRRKLVFSTSNDLDFVFDRPDRSRFTQFAYRKSIRRADAVVVQTEQQFELARQSEEVRGELTRIPSFAELATAATEAGTAFLWVGRLADYKLPLEYVRLAKSLPEARFRMIAGQNYETPPSLKAALDRATKEVTNLEVVGFTPRPLVLDAIATATAVVVTSRYEGMPNVLLEAWARGVPALSLHFDPDGVIETEQLGLVANGSRQRLLEMARLLWTNPESRSALGRNARDYVRKTHSSEVVAESWQALLERTLGEPLAAKRAASQC